MGSLRPKILLFFEYATLNGGEFSLLAMLESLGQSEFSFVAAVPPSGPLNDRLKQRDIPTLPLTLRDSGGQKRPLAEIDAHLMDLIHRVSPDLVHANSLAMGRMVGRIAPQLTLPCTAHLRDIVTLSRKALSDLNQNDGLIAVSQATKKYHSDQGLLPDKMQVIYNGVDEEAFRPMSDTGLLRQELGLDHNALLIGNIGQICLRKGQTLLAQAAVALADVCPEANTLFIGERYSQKAESIAYEKQIRLIFREAGIEDRLFCLGFREDVPRILNEIDLLVHSAHQEPLGRVLLEAAFCGKAIVATEVGGTSEILSHEHSALLVPPNDLHALKASMVCMLSDRDLRKRLGERARAKTQRAFSIASAAAVVRSFWRSYLSGH